MHAREWKGLRTRHAEELRTLQVTSLTLQVVSLSEHPKPCTLNPKP